MLKKHKLVANVSSSKAKNFGEKSNKNQYNNIQQLKSIKSYYTYTYTDMNSAVMKNVKTQLWSNDYWLNDIMET